MMFGTTNRETDERLYRAWTHLVETCRILIGRPCNPVELEEDAITRLENMITNLHRAATQNGPTGKFAQKGVQEIGQRTRLTDELRRIEEGYVVKIEPTKRRRAAEIVRILNECICRECGKKYDRSTSRADFKGFCSAKCMHAKSRSLGYRASKGMNEYEVLARHREIGDVLVCHD